MVKRKCSTTAVFICPVLSRIDRLAEREKTTLRVDSVIGRIFRADWLSGYYPDLGEQAWIQESLERLAALDITPLDSPEPDLAYLLKHIVTHEVTYESLPFALRAQLHEQLVLHLEDQVGAEQVRAELGAAAACDFLKQTKSRLAEGGVPTHDGSRPSTPVNRGEMQSVQSPVSNSRITSASQ